MKDIYAITEPIKEGVTRDDLQKLISLSSVGENYSTGLFVKRINPKISVDDVITYLKTLDYRLDHQIDDINDCTERALYGITHARHRYPGCAIGMVEGLRNYLPLPGQPLPYQHAVIGVWNSDATKYKLFDPLLPDEENLDFGHIARITAFPFHFAKPNKLDLTKEQKPMTQIKVGDCLKWDLKYNIYPMDKDQKGVLNYLNARRQDSNCSDLDKHPPTNEAEFKDYFGDLDRAFWAYMHIRRDYPGCATGVALIDPATNPRTRIPNSMYVNIIWYLGADGELHVKYWDSRPDLGMEVNVKQPKLVFY